MAKITRYDGDLQAFASQAQGTERTVFGDITQADDLDSNINTDFLRGWGIVGVNENPTKQDFNALAYTATQLLAYLHQTGVAEWNVTQEYHTGGLCTTAAGVYRSLVNTNVGNDPDADDGTNWRALAPETAAVYESFDAARLGSNPGVDVVCTTGFYGGWAGTTAGPKGGSTYHRDGTTGTPETAYADNSGFFDANGHGFRLSFTGVVDVTTFGAVGDAATDDTTAIQNAIDYIKASKYGGTIGQATLYFPATDSNLYYLVSDQLLFQDMIQVTIRGGQGAHIRNNTTSDPIFHFEGTVGFGNIFGFHLNNLFLSQSFASNTEGTIKLTRCVLSFFTDLYIDNAQCGYGVWMDSSSGENHLMNVFVEEAGVDGIYCNSDLNHFTNVHVLSSGRYGLNLDSNSRGNTVQGLVTYRSGQHGLYNIGVNNDVFGVFRNNGQDAANTYDGAYLGGVDNTVGGNAYDDQTGVETQRYGFNLQGTRARRAYSSGAGNATALLNASTVAVLDNYNIDGLNTSISDADTTAFPGVSRVNIRYTVPLTANRVVTLSTAQAINGSRFRVIRSATCTGAFNINVGPGPLKSLSSPGTWCDVEYDGVNWVLTASGSL